MVVLLSVIALMVLMAGPAAATTVYTNDDPSYPVLEINARTEVHPAATWAEHAAQSIAKLAATPAGRAVEVAVGLYNALVNKSVPVTSATINF